MSHIISEATPLYGGMQNVIRITKNRSIESGDSCNTNILNLYSHAGTHVDAPYHFIDDGKLMDEYPPAHWIFSSPVILNISIDESYLLTPDDLQLTRGSEDNVDLVLIRTGFEKYRSEATYWKDSPGLSPKIAEYLIRTYPDLRAVGVDFISISSIHHRTIGHEAHRAFLEKGILLLEDVSMMEIGKRDVLKQVIVLPLRFVQGDGAPCTIIGWVDD